MSPRVGELVCVPLVHSRAPLVVRVHTPLVAGVRGAGDEATYCLCGADGPAVWIRETCLAQLRERCAVGDDAGDLLGACEEPLGPGSPP